MKPEPGNVTTHSELIQNGFSFNCVFVGFKVYRRFNPEDEDYTYLFYDFFNKTIQTILKSDN